MASLMILACICAEALILTLEANLPQKDSGFEISGNELMKAGERIHNVEKMFNVYNAGFLRFDDYPPRRFMEEPVKSGPLKGELLNKTDWDKMLDKYYKLRGLDQNGIPTSKTMQQLNISYC